MDNEHPYFLLSVVALIKSSIKITLRFNVFDWELNSAKLRNFASWCNLYLIGANLNQQTNYYI